MEDACIFRLSAEEVRRINLCIPAGFKLISPEECLRRSKPTPPKGQAFDAPIRRRTPEGVLELEQPPASAVERVLAQLKLNPSLDLLHSVPAEKGEASWKDILRKVETDGANYRLGDFVSELRRLCQRIYESFSKSDYQYKDASLIEKYLDDTVRLVSEEPEPAGEVGRSTLKRKNLARAAEPTPQGYSTDPPTAHEKRQLGLDLRRLSSDALQHVCEMLFDEADEKEYVFDTELLHLKQFRELQDFVRRSVDGAGEPDSRLEKPEEDISDESVFVIEKD